MNRTDTPDVAELMALLAAKSAEVAALQSENQKLNERVFKLEEELALAQLHRFAPRSEKGVNRLFNEAEQAVLETDADDSLADAIELPVTGLAEKGSPVGKKPKRKLTAFVAFTSNTAFRFSTPLKNGSTK